MQNEIKGTEGLPSQPFRMFAEKYLEVGLCVFPCGKDDGKKPLVTWKPFQAKFPPPEAIDNWYDDFPDANVAIVTGKLSNLTVVDSDDPSIKPIDLFAIYGETPIVIQTPSGGHHLYYRYNGEGNKQYADKKIDIKGQGGFVVAPPSINRIKNTQYQFIEGSIWDFEHLPSMVPQAKAFKCFAEGVRNNALYDYLRSEALGCPTVDELSNIAHNYNNRNLKPPLDDTEVKKVIKSVWAYKKAGRIFQAGKQSIVLDVDKIKEWMCIYPPALTLYVDLKRCHITKGKTFSISPKCYAKRLGWSDKTVAKFRDVLIRYGAIKCVYKGGKFKGDLDKFNFL